MFFVLKKKKKKQVSPIRPQLDSPGVRPRVIHEFIYVGQSFSVVYLVTRSAVFVQVVLHPDDFRLILCS